MVAIRTDSKADATNTTTMIAHLRDNKLESECTDSKNIITQPRVNETVGAKLDAATTTGYTNSDPHCG
jgi:hypothetical protein